MDILFEETFTYPKGSYRRNDLWDFKNRTRKYCDWVGPSAFSIDGLKHLVITAHNNLTKGRWESGEAECLIPVTGKRHIEARIACPRGAGTWPAFWEYRYQYGISPNFEVDVMERLGRELGYHTTAHWWPTDDPNHPQKGTHLDTGAVDLHNFHIYGADIVQDRVLYYFDKTQVYEVLASDIGLGGKDLTKFTNALVLDLDMGGSWAGPITCASPQKMVVDYVRATRLP